MSGKQLKFSNSNARTSESVVILFYFISLPVHETRRGEKEEEVKERRRRRRREGKKKYNMMNDNILS